MLTGVMLTGVMLTGVMLATAKWPDRAEIPIAGTDSFKINKAIASDGPGSGTGRACVGRAGVRLAFRSWIAGRYGWQCQ